MKNPLIVAMMMATALVPFVPAASAGGQCVDAAGQARACYFDAGEAGCGVDYVWVDSAAADAIAYGYACRGYSFVYVVGYTPAGVAVVVWQSHGCHVIAAALTPAGTHLVEQCGAPGAPSQIPWGALP